MYRSLRFSRKHALLSLCSYFEGALSFHTPDLEELVEGNKCKFFEAGVPLIYKRNCFRPRQIQNPHEEGYDCSVTVPIVGHARSSTA